MRSDHIILLQLLRTSRPLGAGFAIGVAGAFKVYPWIMAVPLVLLRSWKAVIGVALGAAGTLGAVALVIPARYSIEFFFTILPRLGGVSLSYENLSLIASLGRFVSAMVDGRSTAQDLDVMYLEQEGLEAARALSRVLWAAAVAAVAIVSWGRRSWFGQLPSGKKEIVAMALATCGMLALMPTSWLSYQVVLVLPVVVLIAWIPTGSYAAIVLLALSVAAGTLLYGYEEAFQSFPEAFSVARAAIPYAVGAALVLTTMSGSKRIPAA